MRSIRASVISLFTPVARKLFFTPSDKLTEKLYNRKEYVLPKTIRFPFQLKIERYKDRNIYYLNPNSKSKKTVFYFHGGGYVHDFFDNQWDFLKKVIKETDAKAIAIDYPLAPIYNYKDCYELVVPFYKEYVEAHPDEEIIFLGESAGGGMCGSFYLEFAKLGLRLPDKMILISPWTDMSNENKDIEKYRKKDRLLTVEGLDEAAGYWCGDLDRKDYRVSPMFGDLSLFKNVLVIFGDHELFYPDCKIFSDSLVKNPSNKYMVKHKMGHVYPLYPTKEAKEAICLIGKRIKLESRYGKHHFRENHL